MHLEVRHSMRSLFVPSHTGVNPLELLWLVTHSLCRAKSLVATSRCVRFNEYHLSEEYQWQAIASWISNTTLVAPVNDC